MSGQEPLMKRLLAILVVITGACSGSTTSTTQAVTSAPTTAIPTTSTVSTAMTQPQTDPATTADGDEVGFTSDGLEMVGDLRLPVGAEPAPAVVLIHGSGPHNRDAPLSAQLNMSFGFEIAVFAEIAMGLQDKGIGVLTYDKRTCGSFNNCGDTGYPLPTADLTVDAFIADAQAAVAYLRSRPEIDPDRISVIGHSQGAQFIPILLQADPRLASGVMVAGPFRPIDEILRAQLDFTIDLLSTLGVSEEEALASPGVAEFVEMADAVDAIRQGSDEPAAATSAAFWRSWFDIYGRGQAAAGVIDQPMLVLNGELDWNVDVSEAEAWREFLHDAGANHEIMTLPCITHALNCVTESNPAAITGDDLGTEVAPEVIAALVDFLTR
jgi:pimeloyl-ACP methyl ester carboxylesterase